VKTLRKILVLRETLKTKPLARLVYHTKVKGAVTEAKGEAAEAEVEAGAKAIMEKESGIAFSTKRMMTTPQTIA
jgi:hypothetical protein